MKVRNDCPECRSAGSVERGVCQVCLVDDIREAPGVPIDLTFADVVAELEAVATLAARGEFMRVAEACRRARSLLERLREQFMAQVILAPAGIPPVPEPVPEPDPVPA
jgi:hypothetical protein